MSRVPSSPTSVRPAHRSSEVRHHLRLVQAQPPVRSAGEALVVEQLDAWTLAPAAALSPTTICWVEDLAAGPAVAA